MAYEYGQPTLDLRPPIKVKGMSLPTSMIGYKELLNFLAYSGLIPEACDSHRRTTRAALLSQSSEDRMEKTSKNFKISQLPTKFILMNRIFSLNRYPLFFWQVALLIPRQ